ncbi:MAG: ABC transporter ATP-binding protein/permease [Candidatus Obscuribacter sp.]|jgi:putative ATP-binding cassette transporter|nr:ABC transporter ATP-binding protein/permease [Candidatus Obscuribacter sp.]MBK9770935.1 ABC transporter ATP-binding protein/permease [Candidatus Obscuribacter sp.]
MTEKTSAFSLALWRRVYQLAKPFFTSRDPWEITVPVIGTKFTLQERWKAWGLLVTLALFLFGVNMLNVGINFVAGNFQNSLQQFLKAGGDVGKQGLAEANYWKYLYLYGGVFIIGTPIVVFYSWIKSILVITWRKWLTVHILKEYFKDRNYFKVGNNPSIDNPDERIANDVEGFTSGALSLVLSVVDSVITFFSFIFILWMISHTLVGVVVLYAGFGTILSVLLSIKLIQYKYNQNRLEADYRYNLIHVRKNVESIAFYQGEGVEQGHVVNRFFAAIKNNMSLVGYQRNVSMFTTAFNYMVVIVPAFFIAPLFFRGEVEIGAFTQANMAFNQVLSSLSLFVAELGTISAFAAYVSRLGGFREALTATEECDKPGRTAIVTTIGEHIALDKVTLMTPDYNKLLIKEVSMVVPQGTGVIIKGVSGSGKSSLLRAIAGLWRAGSGTIIRPELSGMMFFSQKPYMNLGSLRDQLLYPGIRTDVSDAELLDILKQVNLSEIATRHPEGFEAVRNWSEELSPGMQQRLAFARLLVAKPKIVFLDEATASLDVANEEMLYGLLRTLGATFVSVGHRPSLDRYHQMALTLAGEGPWQLEEQK